MSCNMEGRKLEYFTFEAFRPHFDALLYYGGFVWLVVLCYNLQHIIRVVQVRHNTELVINTLFILLTTLNTLGKHISFNARSRRIYRIFDVINGSNFASSCAYHVKIMKENATVMRRLLLFNISCMLTCGCFLIIFPIVNRAQSIEVQFTGYFPFDTTSSQGFVAALAYTNIFIIFQGYGHVTMDCTVVAFYAQAMVQLRILRYNLEHLVDHREDQHKAEMQQRRLVKCVQHHRQIVWFIKEIESIFAEAMLFQFFVAAMVLCTTVYKIVGLSLFSAEFLSLAMYLGCMLAQFFIYCFYGTQVKYESEFVNQSIYICNWLSLSPSLRKQLLVMMLNCLKPITLRTAYVVPITMDTYIAVLRASYTLFTILDRQ